MDTSRRAFLTGSLTLAAAGLARSVAAATKSTITVYKSPT
jgi:hypothetical protein